MKMELIASLLHKPEVIFLDEPTIGLDVISQKTIREFIKSYSRESGVTVILTSHYMQDIEDLCKRTIIINQGSLVFDGDLKRVGEIFDAKKTVRLQLLEDVADEKFARFGTLRSREGLTVTIDVDRKLAAVHSRDMLTNLPVSDLTIEEAPIEDGIAMLYARGAQPFDMAPAGVALKSAAEKN
jgi:ABC-2 type transport system ATP-binding protein